MRKILQIKETKKAIVLSVVVETPRRSGAKEIARFANSGMGWAALGASGRWLIQNMMLDEVTYVGSIDTYHILVGVGVIDPKVAIAA
jgi:hypothetical protein